MILTAWLLHSIRLAAALGTALLLMQAPAVTREYQAALLQLVRSSDQEIAERKASAQRFYGIGSGEGDKQFLSELQDRRATSDRLHGFRQLRTSARPVLRRRRLWPGRAVPGLADRRVADRCSATASRPGAKMNRFLTASRLLADLPLTKVDGRQIEFTVRAASYAGHLGCRTDSPQRPGKSEYR